MADPTTELAGWVITAFTGFGLGLGAALAAKMKNGNGKKKNGSEPSIPADVVYDIQRKVKEMHRGDAPKEAVSSWALLREMNDTLSEVRDYSRDTLGVVKDIRGTNAEMVKILGEIKVELRHQNGAHERRR